MLFLLLGACSKKSQIVGRVINGENSVGIAGASVYLLELMDDRKELGKALYLESNDLGYFAFKKPRDRKKLKQVLICDLLKDQSYFSTMSDSIFLSEENTNESLNIILFKSTSY